MTAQPVETPVTLLAGRARRSPDRVAMREKRFGVWQDITWADYWEQVQLVAHGLVALGVAPGDRVAIHSENRPEWLFADLGVFAARAVTVGLYPTNPADEVRYLLGDSEARVLIAEDQEQVDKALEVAGDLPHLERIVYVEPRGVRSYPDPRLMSWTALLELGERHRSADPDLLERYRRQVRPDDVMLLIYTSGTTGPPKGAMLTVRNLAFNLESLIAAGGFAHPPAGEDDITLSYLPLCHIAERTYTTLFNLGAGTQVHFAESIDTVQQNLQEVQPTIFFAVPRIWEKIHASVEIKMASASRAKRINYLLWSAAGRWIGERMAANGGSHTLSTRLVYALGYPFLFRSLQDRLGLRLCRYAASGAAPIAPDIIKWFMSIGVPIHELYGMTENTAVSTGNPPGRVKIGTVGVPHQGVELRIDEETGEILIRHPGVFAGYWRKPEETARVLSPDGWLRTGDVGEWVDGTHVRIVDRLKDIIITSGGKNVAPSEIENALKFSPFIKEAVVVGDGRNHLTALVGIELDTVGDWAQRRGIPYTTYRDLSEKPEVLRLVQGVVKEVNARFSRPEQVRQFRMLTKELDHEDGELTATQKVKRAAISEMFRHLVDEMYEGGSRHAGGNLQDVVTPEAQAEVGAGRAV